MSQCSFCRIEGPPFSQKESGEKSLEFMARSLQLNDQFCIMVDWHVIGSDTTPVMNEILVFMHKTPLQATDNPPCSIVAATTHPLLQGPESRHLII